MNNREDSLAKTCKDLMLEEPFYGLFLLMLRKQWSNHIPTAGVALADINYRLVINEDFWKNLSVPHRKGLLKHELLHIGFFHLTDYDHLHDKKVLNIAMDLEINQYIRSEILPPNGQKLELYPELDLKPKAGTHAYYEALMEGKKQGNCPNLNKQLAAMSGGEGSCEVEVGGETETIDLPVHDWENDSEMNEATKKLINSQTKHILNELADQITKSRGTIPSEFESILEKINATEPPRFDWRGFIRRFSRSGNHFYQKDS